MPSLDELTARYAAEDAQTDALRALEDIEKRRRRSANTPLIPEISTSARGAPDAGLIVFLFFCFIVFP